MNRETVVFHSIELIERHISQKLSVENIANSVCFSPYHYGRLFREIIGVSVMNYVTKRKLTIAGGVLLETNKTILDIALDFGYSSHESFTRAFKAYMGVTPMEYRKYGLASISQIIVKECQSMNYDETTNEILRELNDFIAKAKETAEFANKSTVVVYHPFWSMIAAKTKNLADKIQSNLERIAEISQNADGITNRFVIIKVIEDVAFETNLLVFNVNLMISRGNRDDIQAQKPICEKYISLAQMSMVKTDKIIVLFNELSALIFTDMRKTAMLKMQGLIDLGEKTVDGLQGYSYIKDELAYLINELSQVPYEQVTAQQLEDLLFRLNIISLAADMDAFRSPQAQGMLEEIKKLKYGFEQALDFFSAFVFLEDEGGHCSHNTEAFFRYCVSWKHFAFLHKRGNIGRKVGHIPY